MARLAALLCAILLWTNALADPLEERVMALAAELRCLVCQNQTIAESNAPLALDLRSVIREKLAAGETDAQVLAYMRARYGEFVLYRPPLGASTLALWFGPLALIVIACIAWIALVRRRAPERDPA